MPDRRQELARILVKKTKDGSLNWQGGPGDDTVIAVLERGRVVLAKESRGEVFDIVIRVYNAEGELAEAFSDVDLTNITNSEGWFDTLDAMYVEALRSAQGADSLISELIAELNDDIPF